MKPRHLTALALLLISSFTSVLAAEYLTLNDAVERGLIRIISAKSTGGYSRFQFEIENLSGRELFIDPYGSAFDPPQGAGTQRIGIGLPIKAGTQKIDLRGPGLSTNPGEEVPTGGDATGGEISPEAMAAAGAALGGMGLLWAWLNGMANGVNLNDLQQGWQQLLGRAPPALEPPVATEDLWSQRGWRLDPATQQYSPQPGALDEQGRVWMRSPYEMDGGYTFVSRDEAQQIRTRTAMGEVWDTRYGWKAPEDLDQLRRQESYLREIDRAESLRRASEIANEQRDMRTVSHYLETGNKLISGFEEDPERQRWYRDFLERHAQRDANGHYNLSPEQAQEIYGALRQQLFESRQDRYEADRLLYTGMEQELAGRQKYLEGVRDNAMRANRLLAKLDPTGIGSKIVDLQGAAYGGINGYAEGGVLEAAGSILASRLDGSTQGFASTNYNVLLEYAKSGGQLVDANGQPISLAGKLLGANLEQVNNQWNVVDQAGKVASGIAEGDLGKAFDAAMDMHDAKGDIEGWHSSLAGGAEQPPPTAPDQSDYDAYRNAAQGRADGVRSSLESDQPLTRQQIVEAQGDPATVRNLKAMGKEDSALGERFIEAREQQLYQPTKQETLNAVQERQPGEYRFAEVRTPGTEKGNVNTDNDVALLRKESRIAEIRIDADGNKQVIRKEVWVEVPRQQWEGDFHQAFANNSGFTPEGAAQRFPDVNWKGMSESQQQAKWAELHGQSCTDVYSPEAARDFSTQPTAMGVTGKDASNYLGVRLDADGRELPSPYELAKQGQGKLLDSEGLGLMENYKFSNQWNKGTMADKAEALQQLGKQGKAAEALAQGYQQQGYKVQGLPDNMKQALDVVRDSSLSPDSRNQLLQQHGFRDAADLSNKLSSRIGALRIAQR